MNKMRTLMFCGAAGVAMAVATASTTQAAKLTFDDISTGAFVGSQYFATAPLNFGVTIAAKNNNTTHPDVATIFDSTKTGTPDPDLQTGYPIGNLAGKNLGKLLIVAENVKDSNSNGKIDTPDDEHDGGDLIFSFSKPVASIGFDAIDVEFATPLDYLEFFVNGVSVKTLSFDKFTTSGNQFYDSSVVYGDHSANTIKPITATALGIPAFNSVIFHLGECMAIDNVDFVNSTAPATPEPTTLGLLALATPALLARRRRR